MLWFLAVDQNVSTFCFLPNQELGGMEEHFMFFILYIKHLISIHQFCNHQQVSVNGLDKAGSTPLHWASHGGHIDCLQTLLAAGNIEVNVQVHLGTSGYIDIVRYFLVPYSDLFTTFIKLQSVSLKCVTCQIFSLNWINFQWMTFYNKLTKHN